MRPRRQAGFSIIELVVTLGVFAVLLGVGLPSFLHWMQNQQIRAAADALSSGLQVAKNEAVRRNARVQLQLVNISGWRINLANDPNGDPIQAREHGEGSPNVTVTTFPQGADTVTFNSLGRVVTNQDGSPSLNRVLIENPILQTADMRPLNVVIPTAGGSRMCDPKVPATDPRSCPVFP